LAPTKFALTVALAIGFAFPARAAEDKVYVKYRQKVMTGVGADMGAISDILKYGLPYTAAIALHANRLGDAAALIPTAFEQKVTAGETDAKPEIWQKPDEFKDKIETLKKAAATLEEAADGADRDDIQVAYKKLGKACGGCHKAFRKPKEESYKKR